MLIFHLGVSLLKNLQKSLFWSKTQHTVVNKASECLPTDTLIDWNKMQQEFDQDHTKPNPYEEPDTCKFVRLFLTFPTF